MKNVNAHQPQTWENVFFLAPAFASDTFSLHVVDGREEDKGVRVVKKGKVANVVKAVEVVKGSLTPVEK